MSTSPPGSEPVEPSPPGDGFQVPPRFGVPSGPDDAAGAYDPLVPPPFGGLRPAWERFQDLWRRGWQPLTGLFVLTFAIPQILQAWVVNTMLEGVVTAGGGLVLPADDGTGAAALPTAAMTVWLVLSYLVVSLIAAAGWAAGIWFVTQVGAGLPASIGAALSAGLRRLVPMFGWYVLYTVMITIGAVLCLLPGLYLLVAGGLFSFAVMFERGRNPMGRSFSLVHRTFGMVLGRFGLLALVMIGASCLAGLCVLGIGGLAGGTGGQFIVDAILAVVLVPVYVMLLVGLLLTYTQARARHDEVSTAGLWAAVNDEAAGSPPAGATPAHPA